MKRATVIILVIFLGLITLTGCMSKGRETEIKYVIGVSLANLSEQWRLVLKDELEDEAAKYSSVRLIVLDAAGDSKKQAADVEKLMEFDVDLLIISPNDVETLTPVISDAYETTPVIVLDRVVEGYDYSMFIGPDNELIGRQAGNIVLEILKENEIQRGSVLELKNSSFASTSRSEDFCQTLSEAGVATSSVFLKEPSRDDVEDYLYEHPEILDGIDVIFAHNDYLAYGAYLALQKLKLYDIKIVGLDGFSGEKGGLQMIENGIIDATVTCPTGGREAIRYAIDIINGESDIPKQIILRSHKVRADNVKEFQKNTRESVSEKDIIHVGYAQIAEDSSWRNASIESIQAASREFGIDLTVEYNEQSVKTQIEQVREFIAQGMDAIVISPVVSDGWQEIFEEAYEAKIPVLLVDRMVNVDEELYDSFIGADFYEEGRRCARWMLEETKDMSQIRIMEIRGTEGASPTQNRKEGFEEIISTDKRYQIVYSECGDYTREGGRKIVENYLMSNEWDIDVIFSHNDEMVLGIVEVLKEHGIKPGTDVKIVSIDGVAEALTLLKKGELNCIVECNPLLGPEIMKAITDLMEGKELPLRIITDETVFTEDTPKELFQNRRY